jgi:3-oxoacyl-(acyl-carrier-protein) synthase
MISIKPRVFITGIGVISALDSANGDTASKTSVEEFFDNLCNSVSGIKIAAPNLYALQLAAVKYDPDAYFSKMQLLGLDRTSQLALIAAQRAVQDALLDESAPMGERVGLYMGCASAGTESTEHSYANFFKAGGELKKPLTVPAAMMHAPASQVAIKYGIQGECLTYSTACSSSTVAIGEAFWRLRDGQGRSNAMNMAIAGGAESMLMPAVLSNWRELRVVCKMSCRPFSEDRDGFAMGEGAAMFVLETEESAKRRGIKPLAEVIGYGSSNDASHITKPASQGQALAMKRALEDAQINSAQVGYINAHGTATLAGDAAEAASIRKLFDHTAAKIPISATKASHGHLIGASGAVELVAAAMALQKQRIPLTLSTRRIEPDLGLDIVIGESRDANNLEIAMSNSFAFGGSNASLLLRRCP